MSSIASNSEDLILNADGGSSTVKFKIDGTEKASISSAGLFTSTTIDATKLTGTIPNFTSTGIDDNADATAITIDSNEKVGIATTTPNGLLTIGGAGAIGTQTEPAIQIARSSGNANSYRFGIYTTAEGAVIENKNGDDGIAFNVKTTGQTLQLTTDGRGLSQFTAKAWVNFNGQGTIAINDSHNVSSITDNGTGDTTVTYSNAMANSSYASVGMAGMSNTSQQVVSSNHSPNTAYTRFQTAYNNGNLEDTLRVMVAIFGD